MEAERSMEMAPGALPRPGRVPEQELLSLELGFSMAVGLRCVSGKIVGGSSVFTVLGILYAKRRREAVAPSPK